ncbi:MAG: hypothetical protein FD151_1636, partial [bacterium]
EYSSGTGIDLSNIGHVYEKMGELDKAMSFYERAFKVNERLGIKERTDRDLESIKRIQGAMRKKVN